MVIYKRSKEEGIGNVCTWEHMGMIRHDNRHTEQLCNYQSTRWENIKVPLNGSVAKCVCAWECYIYIVGRE